MSISVFTLAAPGEKLMESLNNTKYAVYALQHNAYRLVEDGFSTYEKAMDYANQLAGGMASYKIRGYASASELPDIIE